jgi:hypothetical protein
MTTIRELTKHKINPANDILRVFVLDEIGSGGAHHVYVILTPIKDDPFKHEKPPSIDYDISSSPAKLKMWPFQGFAEITVDHLSSFCTVHIIPFQNGPIKEVGVNGHTHEAYLAILIDRMECFQAGKYASHDNQMALDHLEEARMWLLKRTQERMNRGVEGTHKN